MGRFLGPESGLYKVLSQLADLLVLNLLFLLCCLPVVTIGASLSAMYSVALKIVSDRSSGIVKPFFRAFKGSFLKATVLWLIYLVIGAAIYFGLNIVNNAGLPWFFKLVYAVVTILLVFTMTWTWALEAQFDNPVFKTMKNALILSLAHPLRSLAAVVLNLIPLGILVLFGGQVFASLGFIWFLFGFSCTAVLNCLLFKKVFGVYIKRKEESCEETGREQSQE